MSLLVAELELRWSAIFEALAGGSDVPPARRLRAEGLMEAAVLTGAATAVELVHAMDQSYQRVFGQSLAQDFGDNWNDFFPFPQIPAMGKLAPVYPSTAD